MPVETPKPVIVKPTKKARKAKKAPVKIDRDAQLKNYVNELRRLKRVIAKATRDQRRIGLKITRLFAA